MNKYGSTSVRPAEGATARVMLRISQKERFCSSSCLLWGSRETVWTNKRAVLPHG